MKIGILILLPIGAFLLAIMVGLGQGLNGSFGSSSYAIGQNSTTATATANEFYINGQCYIYNKPTVPFQTGTVSPCPNTAQYAANYVLSGLFVGAVLAVILAGTVLAGISIFGSGLSPEAVHTIYVVLAFGSLYTALAVPAYTVYSAMPYGSLIFGILSLMYLIGVIGAPLRGT